MSKPSTLEKEMLQQIWLAKLPTPKIEHRFAPPRRFRFDLCWPEMAQPLALEIEGGIHVQGRHTRGSGFETDCEKYNLATLLGWRVLRVTAKHIKSGQALKWVEDALAQ